jgi:hypothetical protein
MYMAIERSISAVLVLRKARGPDADTGKNAEFGSADLLKKSGKFERDH